MTRSRRLSPTAWRWIAGLLIAYVLAVVVELAVGTDHPGLIPALGFAGCAALIGVSKWLGAHWLQRPEGTRPGGDLDG